MKKEEKGLIKKMIQIREDQNEFINTKPQGRRFNLSAFVRNKLDEWIEKLENEKTTE